MNELTDLYQQLIVDHYRSPRNRGRLERPTQQAEGYNPLCGDRVTLYLQLDGDVVTDVAFEGSGCAISTASTSIMTQVVKGRTVGEAVTMFDRFHELVAGDDAGAAEASRSDMGKLEAFAGVRRFPARVKCATLAWHTLRAAIDARDDLVTTE